ncbi:MAG: hypothetical protein EZS28_002927 [Streblomastix strix]|uniref:Uncharacterized protein n=1 Tax=Streblomastix strix TaxID=222440 RepID=A0A5J4X481_9EUKA|nr:MAG: hypothetical protein EZS28_002927 [Streblomastix strix]
MQVIRVNHLHKELNRSNFIGSINILTAEKLISPILENHGSDLNSGQIKNNSTVQHQESESSASSDVVFLGRSPAQKNTQIITRFGTLYSDSEMNEEDISSTESGTDSSSQGLVMKAIFRKRQIHDQQIKDEEE